MYITIIKELNRKQKEMKINELTNLSPQTISQWRNVFRSLSSDELKTLEEQTGCSFDEFYSAGFTRFVARSFHSLRTVIPFADILKAYEQYKI